MMVPLFALVAPYNDVFQAEVKHGSLSLRRDARRFAEGKNGVDWLRLVLRKSHQGEPNKTTETLELP